MLHAEAFVEGIRAQIAAVPQYAAVTKHRLEPTRDDSIFPIINVTWTADKGPSHGGSKTGIPKFDNTTTIVVEIIDRANDGASLRTQLSTHGEAMMALIMGNLVWGGDVLEGIASVHHQVDLPVEGNYRIGRLQIAIDTQVTTFWPPSTAALPEFSTFSVRTPDALPGIGADITPQL